MSSLQPVEAGLRAPKPAASTQAGFSALIFVTKAVISKDAAWKPNERLVAIAVADRFGPQEDGTVSAFMKVSDIALRTGLSDRTVRRALKALSESPNRLFDRSLGVERHGRVLPIYSFTLAARRSDSEGRGA